MNWRTQNILSLIAVAALFILNSLPAPVSGQREALREPELSRPGAVELASLR